MPGRAEAFAAKARSGREILRRARALRYGWLEAQSQYISRTRLATGPA